MIALPALLTLLLLLTFSAHAEDAQKNPGMTQAHLHELISKTGSNVVVEGNVVQFEFEGTELICISDINADRMRIVSPIVSLLDIDGSELLIALAANFHSVLDVRYAVSEGVVYSAYIHPLSPLSDEEVVSAIRQVATARNTFGGEYTSGGLFFGGGNEESSQGTEI